MVAPANWSNTPPSFFTATSRWAARQIFAVEIENPFRLGRFDLVAQPRRFLVADDAHAEDLALARHPITHTMLPA